MGLLEYWSISSRALSEEAFKLGLEVDIVNKDKNLFYVIGNGKKILFKSTDFGENTSVGYKICLNKRLTYDILERNGFPIAKSMYIKKKEMGKFQESALADFQYPLIIKPLSGGNGDGVMMHIDNYNELHKKLEDSFKIYKSMIIQELIEGDEIRVLVVKGEVILAINRIPAHVIGDGKKTIQKLIDTNNKLPDRNDGYESALSIIEVDDELIEYMNKNDITFDYIPKKGENIQLRGNSNVGSGGTMNEVTHIITPDTKNMCIQIADDLGLAICGVDVILKDYSKDIGNKNGVVLEVNASPGIGGDREYTSVNSGREILKRVFNIK